MCLNRRENSRGDLFAMVRGCAIVADVAPAGQEACALEPARARR